MSNDPVAPPIAHQIRRQTKDRATFTVSASAVVFVLLGLLATFEGIAVLSEAESSIHQIYGILNMNAAAVLMVGAVIIQKLHLMVDSLKKL